MEAGRFREDLYYRLNVIPVHIPPLRERPEDVPALVETFLRRHANGQARSFSAQAIQRLSAQPWRGNARELENFIERALALSDATEIGIDELRLDSGSSAPAAAGTDASLRQAIVAGLSLRDVEERYTEMVLEQTGGNKVRAAKILGIDRKTLYRRAERKRADSE